MISSRCLSLIWSISTVAVVCGTSTRPVPIEQLLLNKIFVDYDKRVRPVLDSKQIANISLGLDLTMVSKVDERNQVLTTHVWLRQEWFDPRLIWDPVRYGNFSKLRIPCDLIWLPDIVLYNSVEDQSRKYHRALAILDFDGKILWGPVVRFMSSCLLDITFFPFDDQICFLKLGSWTYDGWQLDVFKLKQKIDLTYTVANGEWDVKDSHVVKNIAYYPCCKEPFPDITFYIHIRRRHFYYTFNLVVPCIFLSVLTIFSFVLPPDSGEKVTLGLTVLVAYSVFMLLIAGIMPPTSEYTPLISIYLIISMGLTSCIVILNILVLNLHHRGITNRRPPPLLYHLIVRYLGRVVCVSQKSVEKFNQGFGSVNPTSRRGKMLRMLVEATAAGNLAANEEGDSMDVVDTAAGEEGVEMVTVSTCSTDNNAADSNNKNNNSNGNKLSVRSLSKVAAINQTQAITLSYLQQMSSKQHQMEEEAACIREWQLMAYVLDRVFLACFVLLLLVISGYLLILRPINKGISIKAVDSTTKY